MARSRRTSKRIDAIRKEHEKAKTGRSVDWEGHLNDDWLEEQGLRVYRCDENVHYLAIIPPDDSDKYFGLKIFVHWDVGPSDASVICPKLMKIGACPICEKWAELRKEVDANKDLLKSLSPFPPRYLYWVVDMADKDTMDIGIQLFDAPQTINNEIVGLSVDERTGEVLDISDLDDGRNFIFTRKGSGKTGTRYQSFKLEERDPIDEKWLNPPDLSKAILVRSYDEIKQLDEGSIGDFDGNQLEGDETFDEKMEEPEDRAPRQRRSEEEEEEETDREKPTKQRSERESEAEEKPSRTERRPSAPPPPDEQDEDITEKRSQVRDRIGRARDRIRKEKDNDE